MAVILNAKGTSSSTFMVGKKGSLLKKNNNILEVKDNADTNVTISFDTENQTADITRDVADSNELLTLIQDNASATGDVIAIGNDGTGDAIQIVNTNNGRGIYLDNDGSTAPAIEIVTTGTGNALQINTNKFTVNKDGDTIVDGTFTCADVVITGGSITGLSNPTVSSEVATKEYVDSIATGLNVKDSVKVATTTAQILASDFENGDTIDGVVLSTGDRILIKDQADARENGIYVVEASGPPTRSEDADNTPGAEVSGGMFCLVLQGTDNASTGWTLSSPDGLATLGTDNLVFSQFSNVGGGLIEIVQDTSPQLGGDLDINGNDIVSTSNGDIALVPDGSGLVVAGSGYDMSGGVDYAFATKKYVDDNETVPGGTHTNIQYNYNGNFAGDTAFTTDGAGNVDITGSLDVDNINIDGNTITGTSTLDVRASGTVTMESTGGIAQIFANSNIELVADADTLLLCGTGSNSIYIGAATGGANGYIAEFKSNDNATTTYFEFTSDTNDLTINPFSSETNVNINITPKGAGDLILDGLKWPQADGTTDYVLKTDGAGQLSWTAQSGGAPGGTTTQIQYNNAGVFAGDTGFTTDGAGSLTVTGSLDVDNINLDGNIISITDTDGDLTLNANGTGNVNIGTGTSTGNASTIQAYGVDTDVDLQLLGKGTGIVIAEIGYDMSFGPSYAFATKEYVDGVAGIGGLDGLSDVIITTPSADEVLTYNGSQWVNSAASGGADGYLYTSTVSTAPTGSGTDTIVIGQSAAGNDTDNSVVIGDSASLTSSNDKSVIIGSSASGSNLGVISIGAGSSATGEEAIAIGSNASGSGNTVASGTRSVCIGQSSGSIGPEASSIDAIAIGTQTEASATYAIAIGSGADATASDAISIGHACDAGAESAIAIGNSADSDGVRSIAIGRDAQARSDYTIAIGTSANATNSLSGEEYNIAIGYNASTAGSSNQNSVAIGPNVSNLTGNTARLGTSSSNYMDLDAEGRLGLAGSSPLYKTPTYTTAGRPTTNLAAGDMYYDTTVSKPVWYDGSTWRDATGTAV